MIDTETLAQCNNAALVQIGACKFSFQKGIFDEFLINVDPADCNKHGLKIDKDTVDWWWKQPAEVRQSWMTEPHPLKYSMEALTTWMGDNKHSVWAHGSSFDHVILENAWRAVGMEPNWKYWNLYDSRTIFNVAGINNKNLRKNDNMAHNALADAKAQTLTLIELLKDVYDGKHVER